MFQLSGVLLCSDARAHSRTRRPLPRTRTRNIRQFHQASVCVILSTETKSKENWLRYSRAGEAPGAETPVGVESVLALRAVLTDVTFTVVLVHTAVLPRVAIRAFTPGKRSLVGFDFGLRVSCSIFRHKFSNTLFVWSNQRAHVLTCSPIPDRRTERRWCTDCNPHRS